MFRGILGTLLVVGGFLAALIAHLTGVGGAELLTYGLLALSFGVAVFVSAVSYWGAIITAVGLSLLLLTATWFNLGPLSVVF
jgi:hypothetical protein